MIKAKDKVIVQIGYPSPSSGQRAKWSQGVVLKVNRYQKKRFLRNEYKVYFIAAVKFRNGEIVWRDTDDLEKL